MVKAYSYVRLSSDAQLRGDGYRRQLERSRKYAAEHGLELDESFLRPGKSESAFRGHNATSGALKRFLDACEKGEIERGSFLLVESLDRLSRQEVLKSLALFMSLMTAGLTLVTLIDGRQYNIETATEGDIFMMIGSMSRAHDESKTKSLRSGANWDRRRKNLAYEKMTAMAPAWLKLNVDRKSFTIIEDRAAVVRRIFDEAASGIGMYTITKRLNEDKIAPFSRSRGWHQSYIAKILCNPAVHGEFQPHHRVNGERKTFGSPIPDYFPAVVDRETFFLAQGGRHERRQNGAGRKGSQISNLFTGVVSCGYCDGRMHFENKGSGPKGGRYFVCEAGYRQHKCVAIRWRYDDLEASFLAFVEEVDLGGILATKEQASRKAQLETELAALDGELGTLNLERDRAYQLLSKPTVSLPFVEAKLIECEENINVVRQSIAAKQVELRDIQKTASVNSVDKQELRRLVSEVRNRSGNDAYKARAQIVTKLRSIVTSIAVYAGGSAIVTEMMNNWLDTKKKEVPQDPEIAAMEHFEITPTDHQRYFSVGFKDGTFRAVYPSDEDPIKLEWQMLGDRGHLNWIAESGEVTPLRYLD